MNLCIFHICLYMRLILCVKAFRNAEIGPRMYIEHCKYIYSAYDNLETKINFYVNFFCIYKINPHVLFYVNRPKRT